MDGEASDRVGGYHFAVPNRLAVTLLSVVIAAACSNPPVIKEGDAVIVTDFANTTGDAMFDASLRQVVHVGLQQSPFLNVVPDPRAMRTLRQAKKPIDQLAVAPALEICAAAGAVAVVGGSISGSSGTYSIRLEAIDCATRAQKGQVEVRAASREEVIAKTGEAVKMLRETLGEPAATRSNFAVGATDALTGSIDALRPFAMGTRVRSMQGEETAMPFFERAVQLDPNFAAAWAKLGVVASNSGHYDRAREAAQKAYDLRAKTTEFERLYIDWNHAAHNTRNHAAIIAALDKLVATYPRDFAAHNNLGVARTGVGDFEGALTAYQQAAVLAPVEPVLAVNIVYTQLFLGRRAEAYAAMDKILAQRPDPNVAIARWHSAVLAGDANAVTFEQAAGKIVAPQQLLMVRATVAAWQGRLKAYDALVGDLRKQALEAKSEEAVHSLEAAERLTRAAYEGGAALAALEAATRTESDRTILAQNAAFLASSGRIDAAAAAVARLEKEPLDGQPVFLPVAIAKAYIRAGRGELKEAIQDIEATMAEFPHALDLHFHLGRIRELAGDVAGAAKSYRTTLQVLPQLGLNPQIVPVRIYLGKVLAGQGDAAGAKEQFDALRAQWKDRDTDFALSREVR